MCFLLEEKVHTVAITIVIRRKLYSYMIYNILDQLYLQIIKKRDQALLYAKIVNFPVEKHTFLPGLHPLKRSLCRGQILRISRETERKVYKTETLNNP